uniref:GPI mannosyltransferase 2 n=1 Tax=Macrostomum lignano TaxID=282301 RepID=A0A1I8FDB3_9PLAT
MEAPGGPPSGDFWCGRPASGRASSSWSRDNSTEHPDTINVLSRMNIYQEVLLALLYRYTWFGTYLQPIYFYILLGALPQTACSSAACLPPPGSLTGTARWPALSGRCHVHSQQHAHDSAKASTHALREHFSLPFLWLQLFCLSVYFSRGQRFAALHERAVSLLARAQICCFLFTAVLGNSTSSYCCYSVAVCAGTPPPLDLCSSEKPSAGVPAGSSANPMLLTAPALSVCLSGALSVAVSRRWLLPGFGLGRPSRPAKPRRLPGLGLPAGLRRLPDCGLSDFDVRMYNCAGGIRLAALPYLIVHAALFLLTLAGFLHFPASPARRRRPTADEANGRGCQRGQRTDSGGKLSAQRLAREALDGFARHPGAGLPCCPVHGVRHSGLHNSAHEVLLDSLHVRPDAPGAGPPPLLGLAAAAAARTAAPACRLRPGHRFFTLALLVSSARTCYRDNQAVWQNLREFWDPDTVQLMEWISSATPPDAAFTGSMQLLAGWDRRAAGENQTAVPNLRRRKPPHEVHPDSALARLGLHHPGGLDLPAAPVTARHHGAGGQPERRADGSAGAPAAGAAGSQAAVPAPRFCHEIRRSHGARQSEPENPYARLFQLVLENRTFRGVPAALRSRGLKLPRSQLFRFVYHY